jgi:hypothetical protein
MSGNNGGGQDIAAKLMQN